MICVVVAVGLLAFTALAGPRALAAAVTATAAALVWTVAGLAMVDALIVPWVAQALLPLVGISAALAVEADTRSRGRIAPALLVGFAALALVTPPTAQTLGIAGFIGTTAAYSAASLAGKCFPAYDTSLTVGRNWRFSALMVLRFCLFGLTGLRGSFAAFGYGERYLPAAAAHDLRAIGQLLPPPTSLVVRADGPADFVKSPQVLRGLDRLAEVSRDDPAVVRAMSLADLVKLTNQAFNDGLDEYHTIPEDAVTIGRQITMAYAPGFRRFVDRSLSSAALWVHVAGDDPNDLARLRTILEREIGTLEWPGVELGIAGGDGAVALRSADLARSVALGWLAFACAAATVLAASTRATLALRAFAGACVGAAFCSGLYGWLGVPVDMIALTGIGAATSFGFVFGVLGSRIALAGALATCAPAALLFSHAAGSLLGYAFAAPLVAPLLVAALRGSRTARTPRSSAPA